MILPGVLGAISLVLALFAFNLLPVNWAGVALILLAIGLFASALTSNQMVSAVIAFVLLLLLFVISQLSQSIGAGLGDLLTKISISDRFDPFERGVIDLRDVVFYLSASALVLFLTVQVVEARRYRA